MAMVAWQGWRLQVPPRWSPVKLEGDYDAGYALFADLHRPRLGLRWQVPGKRVAPADWAQLTLRREVGTLAAAEALASQAAPDWQAPLLYLEPKPPGRDVWVAVSARSGRALQVIHHAHRRERILANSILPTLSDLPMDQPVPWSVFELSCVVPPGLKLTGKHLMAGDLSLIFEDKQRELIVRQVAVAQLALQRLPLEKWLEQQAQRRRKQYRPLGVAEPAQLTVDGRTVTGLSRQVRRRRRFFYKRWLSPRVVVLALHDEARDRLVFVESNDDALARQVAATVGFAGANE